MLLATLALVVLVVMAGWGGWRGVWCDGVGDVGGVCEVGGDVLAGMGWCGIGCGCCRVGRVWSAFVGCCGFGVHTGVVLCVDDDWRLCVCVCA